MLHHKRLQRPQFCHESSLGTRHFHNHTCQVKSLKNSFVLERINPLIPDFWQQIFPQPLSRKLHLILLIQRRYWNRLERLNLGMMNMHAQFFFCVSSVYCVAKPPICVAKPPIYVCGKAPNIRGLCHTHIGGLFHQSEARTRRHKSRIGDTQGHNTLERQNPCEYARISVPPVGEATWPW